MAQNRVLAGGRIVAALLAVALGTLVTLAHASPPDPTWVAGFWDAADRDDVVLAITEASWSPAIDGPSIIPADRSVAAIALAGPTTPASPSQIRLLGRSPPLS